MRRSNTIIWHNQKKQWITAHVQLSAKRRNAYRPTIIAALLSGIFTSFSSHAQTISNGANLYGTSMANGTVLNFQGNAYLSDGTSQSTSKDADGTVTFNGAFGGSTITLNDSASHYAFLYFPSGGTLNANNITFSGGRNNINAGGAISTYGGFTIGGSNITFTSNWAHDNGGASGGAISGNDISLNASDITFINNTGARSGGAIWIDGNLTSTGNLWFYNNQAGFEAGIGYGGAIRTQNLYATNPDAVLYMENNKAYLGGGAINANGRIVVEGAASFFNNQANQSTGGALNTGDDISFNNPNVIITFTGNTAGGGGGAISTSGSINIAGHAAFTDNISGVQGGGISVLADNTTISIGRPSVQIYLSNNYAGYDLTGTTIVNNLAQGGAIYKEGSSISLAGYLISIDQNRATGNGGAISTAGGLNITGAGMIENNLAGQAGGAFYLTGSGMNNTNTLHATIDNIVFSGNRAGVDFTNPTNPSGGIANAIHLQNDFANTVLNLIADSGRQILFTDPITSDGISAVTVNINNNGGTPTDGLVTFSGENFTAGSLDTQSSIYANTTVWGGTLEIKDNAEYGIRGPANSLDIAPAASLQSTVSNSGASNVVRAQNIALSSTATIVAQGSSSLELDANNISVGTAAGETVTISTPAASDQLALTGTFSGAGQLLKDGTGSVFLSSANQLTNSGGLYLTHGTVNAQSFEQSLNILQIESGATLEMGTADLGITDAGFMSGNLNGVNVFTKTGSGLFEFNASSTMNQLDHLDGRLNINSDTTLNVTGNATMSGAQTTLGVIVGQPAIDANALTLSNTPTIDIVGYDPLTNLNSYTLIETDLGISGSFRPTVGGVPIQNFVTIDTYLIGSSFVDGTGKKLLAATTLVWDNPVNNSAHGTFNILAGNSFEVGVPLTTKSGNMLAFGWDGNTLNKSGDGTLYLNGTNTYTGLTDVQAGTLILGSEIAYQHAAIGGDVLVHSGATLGGYGQIHGSVHLQDGSTITPGNSPGTLTVGNITFDPGSTYQFEAYQDTHADKILSTGAATINGGKVYVATHGNIWRATNQYTILTAYDGVSGIFDGVDSNLAFLDASLTYDANNVYLTLLRNQTVLGNTFNRINTGNGIESLGHGNPIYDKVLSMDQSSAMRALDNLSGEIHANAISTQLASKEVRNGINQHLLTNTLQPGQLLWLHTWAQDGKIRDDGNAAKTDMDGYGFLVGYDHPLNEDSVMGIALGYERNRAKLAQDRQSRADIDAYHLMLYGKTRLAKYDLRAGLGYAGLSFDTRRSLWLEGLHGNNNGDYNGQQFQTYIEGSRSVKLNEYSSLTPYLNLSYTQVKTDSFRESGKITALTGHTQRNHISGLTVGLQGKIHLGIRDQHQLYANLAAYNRFGNTTPEVNLNFIGGNTYTLKGSSYSKTTALLGLGANFELKPNFNLSIAYEGEFGERMTNNTGKIKAQWQF